MITFTALGTPCAIPDGRRPTKVVAERAFRHARRRGDLAVAEAALEPKTKNLSNFAHRVTLHRATMPSPAVAPKSPARRPLRRPDHAGTTARITPESVPGFVRI
jgi:hypothetical protein